MNWWGSTKESLSGSSKSRLMHSRSRGANPSRSAVALRNLRDVVAGWSALWCLCSGRVPALPHCPGAWPRTPERLWLGGKAPATPGGVNRLGGYLDRCCSCKPKQHLPQLLTCKVELALYL